MDDHIGELLSAKEELVPGHGAGAEGVKHIDPIVREIRDAPNVINEIGAEELAVNAHYKFNTPGSQILLRDGLVVWSSVCVWVAVRVSWLVQVKKFVLDSADLLLQDWVTLQLSSLV